MPKSYAHEPTEFVPGEIDDKVMLSIGKLIRAFAEIEDRIFVYLCLLAEVSETRGVVLFGSVPLQKKLEMAEYLAQTTGQKITDIHRAVFNDTFKEALSLRNTVAHATFLGVEPKEGRLVFLTNKTSAPEAGSARLTVEGWLPENIIRFAESSGQFLESIEHHLMLKPSLEKRRSTTLQAHPKARRPRSNSQKRGAPPQSSKA